MIQIFFIIFKFIGTFYETHISCLIKKYRNSKYGNEKALYKKWCNRIYISFTEAGRSNLPRKVVNQKDKSYDAGNIDQFGLRNIINLVTIKALMLIFYFYDFQVKRKSPEYSWLQNRLQKFGTYKWKKVSRLNNKFRQIKLIKLKLGIFNLPVIIAEGNNQVM